MSHTNQALDFVNRQVHQLRPYKVGVPPGHITVKLNQNESPLDLPDEVRKEILQEWQNIAFNRYPSEHPDELAGLIADHIGWNGQGILLGNGSNELTFTLGLAFMSSRNRVILPRPMFSFYERVATAYGVEIVSVAPDTSLAFDTTRILSAIRKTNPSMVVITSPNNPTGLVVPLEEVREIADAAPGLVLIDEAYIEFSEEPSILTVLEHYPNVILLRTFSKAFGLAGVRTGYLIGEPGLVSEIRKVRPPFMMDRFSVCTVKQVLLQSHLIRSRTAQIRSQTRGLIQALQEIQGVRVLAGQANFVTFQPPCDSGALFRLLAEAGVLVRDMRGYAELRGFLRVSTGTPAENRIFLQELTKALSKLPRLEA